MYRYMYIIDIRMYIYINIYTHTLQQQSKLTMEHPLPTLIGGGQLDLAKALQLGTTVINPHAIPEG